MRNKLIALALSCGAIFFVLACASSANAQNLQKATLSLTPTAGDAVLPIMAWPIHSGQPDSQRAPVVIGTGFLVDRQGHFVTAAHVVRQAEGIEVQLRATLRQRDGNGMGAAFQVIDVDVIHDLALCQIEGLKVYSEKKSPSVKATTASTDRAKMARPFASLEIASKPPVTGSFVLLSGFPLGSWTPTIQLGMIAATHTIYPPGLFGVPRDGGICCRYL